MTLLTSTGDVRYRYHRPGQVAATSVVCSLVGEEWQIEAEIIASMAPRESFMVPGVSVSPGVAHAVRAGNTLYVQGQVARKFQIMSLWASTTLRCRPRRLTRNIDDILRGAGATWDNVVRIKTYLIDRKHGPAVRRERGPVPEARRLHQYDCGSRVLQARVHVGSGGRGNPGPVPLAVGKGAVKSPHGVGGDDDGHALFGGVVEGVLI